MGADKVGTHAGSRLLSPSTPAIWRRRTASANRPDIEHSPRRERRQHLATFFARVGVEVEGSAGQTGLFAYPYALLVLPDASAPGCRFAGRIIPRSSGKLASVRSADA